MTAPNWRALLAGAPLRPDRTPPAPLTPTRLVVRDGVTVRQVLRLTAHGDRWLDEPLEKDAA